MNKTFSRKNSPFFFFCCVDEDPFGMWSKNPADSREERKGCKSRVAGWFGRVISTKEECVSSRSMHWPAINWSDSFFEIRSIRFITTMLKILSEQSAIWSSDNRNFCNGRSDPTERYFLITVDREEPSIRAHTLHGLLLSGPLVVLLQDGVSHDCIACSTQASHESCWLPKPTTKRPRCSDVGNVGWVAKSMLFFIQKSNVDPARKSKVNGLIDMVAAIGWPHCSSRWCVAAMPYKWATSLRAPPQQCQTMESFCLLQSHGMLWADRRTLLENTIDFS